MKCIIYIDIFVFKFFFIYVYGQLSAIKNLYKSSFGKKFSCLISNLGHTCTVHTLLLSVVCLNNFIVVFYGSLLWYLNGPGTRVQSLCVDWRKSLRSLRRVHPMTHCDVIAALSDQLPIKISLEKRCIQNSELRTQNFI